MALALNTHTPHKEDGYSRPLLAGTSKVMDMRALGWDPCLMGQVLSIHDH